MSELSRRILQRRLELGLSQEELAQRCLLYTLTLPTTPYV